MLNLEKMTWCQKSRLQGIEVIVLWYGKVNSTAINKAFGVSKLISNRDIKTYMSIAPGNIKYDGSLKTYTLQKEFKPLFENSSLEKYFSLQEGERVNSIQFESLEFPSFKLSPDIVRPILQSIVNNQGIKIDYRSLNHPEGRKRIIYPHHFINSGFRWHVRAFCETNLEFRDFNLARFKDTPQITSNTPDRYSILHDDNWNNYSTIKITANPDLSKEQRKLISIEFSMKDNILSVDSRNCLIQYYLQAYQVPTHATKGNPKESRLVLINKEEIQRFLF